jgi:hypothetical protein
MSETEIIKPRRRGWCWKLPLILASLVVIVAVGGRAYHRYKFPYGYSHACAKGLSLALRIHAGSHDGWLPHGGTTPEASLGLLAKEDLNTALWVLPGKNLPRAAVHAALTNEAIAFGPESCGWHYVEGLREDDDPEIVVAWDKTVGLDHNGGRQMGLAHECVWLSGSTSFASTAEWEQLIGRQKEKLAKVIASRASNAPPIRWSDEATLGPNRCAPPARK